MSLCLVRYHVAQFSWILLNFSLILAVDCSFANGSFAQNSQKSTNTKNIHKIKDYRIIAIFLQQHNFACFLLRHIACYDVLFTPNDIIRSETKAKNVKYGNYSKYFIYTLVKLKLQHFALSSRSNSQTLLRNLISNLKESYTHVIYRKQWKLIACVFGRNS